MEIPNQITEVGKLVNEFIQGSTISTPIYAEKAVMRVLGRDTGHEPPIFIYL